MLRPPQDVFVWMLLFVSVGMINGYIKHYRFQPNCVYTNHKVDDDDTFYADYDGTKLNRSTCSIGFYISEEPSDRKLCVEADSFKIKDCKVKVIFSEDKRDGDKSFSCKDHPKRVCLSGGKHLRITLENADEVQPIFHKRTNNKFSLQIYMHSDTQNDKKMAGIIVGSVVGGLLLCFAVMLLVVFLTRRSKKKVNEGLLISKDDEDEYPSVGSYGSVQPSAPVQQLVSPVEAYDSPPGYGDVDDQHLPYQHQYGSVIQPPNNGQHHFDGDLPPSYDDKIHFDGLRHIANDNKPL